MTRGEYLISRPSAVLHAESRIVTYQGGIEGLLSVVSVLKAEEIEDWCTHTDRFVLTIKSRRDSFLSLIS